MTRHVRHFTAVASSLAVVLALIPAGCRPKGDAQQVHTIVPAPINLLLPKSVEIHPFTQVGSFRQGGQGLHARIRAVDTYGDSTKAFGHFRFELYQVRPQHPDGRGERLGQWEISVAEPQQNLVHWDRHTRSYEFKLGWKQSPAPGEKLLLVTYFSSAFTPRLTTERELIAGE